MPKPLLYILLLLFSCSGIDCFAQSIPMRHFTKENGLPSNNVYDVFRDSKGFLWFGTDKGVVRYNGIVFEKFSTADGLSDNEIFLSSEDRQGRIWFSTYNGKLCFYKDGKFYNEKNTPFLKLPFIAYTSRLIAQKDGNIIITNGNGRYFAHVIGDKITTYDILNIVKKYKIENYYISIAADSGYIINTTYQQLFIDKSCRIKKVATYKKASNYYVQFVNQLKSGCLIKSDKVYDFQENLLFKFSYSKINENDIFIESILKVFYDSVNQFLCTRTGLYMANGMHLFNGIIVTGIGTDMNGDYWVSTYYNGIYHLSKHFNYIKKYDNIGVRKIFSPYAVNGKFYYVSWDDFYLRLFYSGKNYMLRKIHERYSNVSASFTVGRGHIFLSHNRNHLDVISPNGVVRYAKSLNEESGFVHMANNDTYLYAWDNYYVHYLLIDSILKQPAVRSHNIFDSHLKSTRIITAAKDGYGNLWFCTNDSVYKITGSQLMVQKQLNVVFRKILFQGSYLIGYDVGDTLYIYKNNPSSLNLIKKIYDKSLVWGDIFNIGNNTSIIATNSYYELLKLGDHADQCTISSLEDPFIPTNSVYIYADSSACYFVYNESITQLPLPYLSRTPSQPRVYFTDLKTKDTSLSITDKIILSPGMAKNLNIGFTGLSFSARELFYEYSITNNKEDTNWVSISGNGISLGDPGYNTYYVKLRAKGISTAYSVPVAFQLIIEHPFWLSWWFITLTVLLSLAFVFLLSRYIIVTILRRRRTIYELESRYQTAEYKTLNALMNPHFIFNSLNNIKGLMNRDDKKTANKFLNSFSNVVRQNMQNISKENVTLHEELELVSKYMELEKMRFGEFINYKIDVESGINTEEILIAPLLIQPLVENAVKHGLLPRYLPDNLITISVYGTGRSVCIEVKDNGLGMESSNASEHEGYESLGLQNIEKRVSYLRQSGKQQIFFSIGTITGNGTPQGTRAVIEIMDDV